MRINNNKITSYGFILNSVIRHKGVTYFRILVNPGTTSMFFKGLDKFPEYYICLGSFSNDWSPIKERISRSAKHKLIEYTSNIFEKCDKFTFSAIFDSRDVNYLQVLRNKI